MLSHFESQLGDDNEAFLINTFRADASFRLRREKNEKVSYERLVTKHKDGDKQFELPLDQESDGTIRYLNLLPILYWAGQQNNRGVYLIDELEDSLHPKLTEELLRRFLNSTGNDQCRQLIFTTHEVHLLRCDMLRRDEIWLVEKHGHNSELVRLTDFSTEGVRDGMDLQKAYMSGRLGGVPRL
jgi:Predicted ATPases